MTRLYKTLADAFQAHTKQLSDGHVAWVGYRDRYSNAPIVCFRYQRIPAPQAAFQLHHGRKPVGKPLPTCGMKGCVAGGHLADRPMRQANRRADALYGAIFGGAV